MNKKQSGFTLIELMIVLVAGGLLLAWASTKGAVMWEDFKVTRFIDDVNAIGVAANQKYGNSASYGSATIADLGKRLPDSIGDGVGTNPWGGNYSLGPGTEPRTYIITGTKLQERNGLKVEDKWVAATYNLGTETVSITFGK